MKFIKKIPEENKKITDKLISEGWNNLKEPSRLSTAIIFSMPIAVVLMFFAMAWFCVFFPKTIDLSDNIKVSIDLLKIPLYIVGIFAFTFLHEMIHALLIPNALKSNKTYWGMNGCFGFVYSEEIIKKRRYILISVMPLFVLSFLFPLILKILGIYSTYALLLCVINAGGACVDIFNIILVLIQVPKSGNLINNGMKTFYV